MSHHNKELFFSLANPIFRQSDQSLSPVFSLKPQQEDHWTRPTVNEGKESSFLNSGSICVTHQSQLNIHFKFIQNLKVHDMIFKKVRKWTLNIPLQTCPTCIQIAVPNHLYLTCPVTEVLFLVKIFLIASAPSQLNGIQNINWIQ